MDTYKFIGFIKNHWFETQLLVALFLGMILQYVFEKDKNKKVLFTIITSSLLVALLTSNLIVMLDGLTFLGLTLVITPTSPLIIIGVGLSTLISMQVVSLVITFFPAAIRERIKSKLIMEIKRK